MRFSRWMVISLACCAMLGCHQNGFNEIVERELRLQEDQIYGLKDHVAQYQAMLESCRRENRALKRELGIDAAGDVAPGETNEPVVPQSEPIPRLRPPKIDLGSPAEPEAVPGGVPESESPDVELPAIELPEPQPELPGPSEPTNDNATAKPDAVVSRLVVNKQLTGGLDIDGRPGDEGIMVVVEPQTADGRLVRPVGEVSLLVVDPRRPGRAGRIARWDFTSDEAATAWRKTPLGRGLHFELPWPAAPPSVKKLRLYVRMITPQGRKLLAAKDISVDPPGGGPAARTDQARRTASNGDGVTAEAKSPSRSANGWQPQTRSEAHPMTPPARPAQASPRLAARPRSAPAGPKHVRKKRPVWAPYR